jgi:hypothetical protein
MAEVVVVVILGCLDVIVDWFCGEDKASNKLTLGTVCMVAYEGSRRSTQAGERTQRLAF